MVLLPIYDNCIGTNCFLAPWPMPAIPASPMPGSPASVGPTSARRSTWSRSSIPTFFFIVKRLLQNKALNLFKQKSDTSSCRGGGGDPRSVVRNRMRLPSLCGHVLAKGAVRVLPGWVLILDGQSDKRIDRRTNG